MHLELLILGIIICFVKGAQHELPEVFAEAGSQTVLPCKCSPTSAFPLAVIWSKVDKGTVWRIDRSGLQYRGTSWNDRGVQRAQSTHSQYEKGDYRLHINDLREEDGGVYSCKIEHKDRVDETMVQLRIMKVTISPSVAMVGQHISVTCSVTPWPVKASVQWTLNNMSMTEMTSFSGAPTSHRRVEAMPSKAGKWTCAVAYRGKEGRASATLTVKGISKPSKDSTKLYSAVGSKATLPCVFSQGLNPVNPVWEKLKPEFVFKPTPGRLPTSFSPPSPASQTPWDKSASLKEVTFGDGGRFRCSATVEGKRFARDMQLVVAKIESSVVSKKNSAVALTCQLTDSSEVTDFEWVHVVHDFNSSQTFESIQKGKTITIDRVSEENQGEWVCRFYGKEGMLGNVTYHLQLMSGLTGEKSSGLPRNTGAIVGLSILLLVLLLILAQTYKNHRRRKRIFQYPALETIVHTASNEREQRERNQVNK